MDRALGNFIANQWVLPQTGATVRSINPATPGDVVLEVPVDPDHMHVAARAAAEAYPAWSALSTAERVAGLKRFAKELASRTELLAEAITAEMGKTLRESRQEAASLVGRVDLVANQQIPRVSTWTAPGVAGECRYHPLGVIGVIGPYNFPLHLFHAHVIPALATGNTVVIKPSSRNPLAAQRYVQAWEAAELPPVLHMVQGGGNVGRALVGAEDIRGLAFTGSWQTGHGIEKQLLERPEVLVALEMGGQNMSIVLDDADMNQALEGSLLGGFLSAGQRCTCTSRVLVERGIADAFVERLVQAAGRLTYGDPMTDVFMGPLASMGDADNVDVLCQAGVEAGAEVLLAGVRREVGAFRGPSIHGIAADHDSLYTQEEVFGPDLAITVVEDLDEAIAIMSASEYGLSGSVFTRSRDALEEVYRRTQMGCLNWNRSTNRASGSFPFGGVGKSGNFRPAGGDAVRYTTFPVQLQWNDAGILEDDPHVSHALGFDENAGKTAPNPLDQLAARQQTEETLEPYGLYPEFLPGGMASVDAAQLDPTSGQDLAKRLVSLLGHRGVASSVESGALRFPADSDPAALSDALYALRADHPARFLGRRSPGSAVPAGDALHLPRSMAFHARLTAGDFVPDDKKPPVLDLFRSSGPYLASIDDDPLVLFDPASQIATHAGGLNPPAILDALWTGRFGSHPVANASAADGDVAALQRLADRLRRATDGALPHVAVCGSGAQANEIALAAASRLRPGKRVVVAFEGAFHGRTLLALHTTWNPAKRQRFELDGFQARWAPWPAWDHTTPEPDVDLNDLAGWDQATGHGNRATPPRADPLLAAEWTALGAIEAHLEDDAVVALLVEPMQSEGGERHATGRFFARLRALTTAYGVPLLVDEVQTGFGLGGTFFWHRRHPLPSPPDFVTVAKKAQVGAVLSRHALPAQSEAHLTSVVRGLLQADIMDGGDAKACEAAVLERLETLRQQHPETVLSPRATGFAFGFDLPDKDAVGHVISQRLWRGYMLYGAGERALRFRLHPLVDGRAMDALFARLDASCSLLESNGAPDWRSEEPPDRAPPWPPAVAQVPDGLRLVHLSTADWQHLEGDVAALQAACYEPARRDDLPSFGAMLAWGGAIFVAALRGDGDVGEADLVGTAFAFPLEHVSTLDGPAGDPMLGRGNTLYSADVTVHPDHRGRGLGAALKQEQLRAAMGLTRPDGSPRYDFVTGRNRLGATDAIQGLNARFGAYEVSRHHGQYGEDEGSALYYRIALGAPRPPAITPRPSTRLDLDVGTPRPFGGAGRSGPGMQALTDAYGRGGMNGSVVNKLSLCNFVTPATVRGAEWLRATAPQGLGHLVFASGRDEICDKGLRALKFHRPDGRIAISVGPVATDGTTAAARSLRLPADHPDNWFSWPSTPDPTLDPDGALASLGDALSSAGSEQVLAVVIEPVYAQTGRAVPASFWQPLRDLCDGHDVPLVLMETTTGGYRSGHGMYRSDSLGIQADSLWWYPGGQLGLAFLSDDLYVPDKLTLISTWDGDDVSITRTLWTLRAARQLPIADRAAQLQRLLGRLGTVHGEGLYLTVDTDDGPGMRAALATHGIDVGLTDEGWLRLVPPLDITQDELARLDAAVHAVGSG